MAKKIILRALLPILVFILVLYSVFWFIKSGEIKKNIKEVLEFHPSSSVGSLSSTGFPLSHKIEINNIDLKFDNQISGDHLIINKVTAQAKVFSNEFDANIVGDIIIKTSNGTDNTIKFNKEPELKFTVSDYKINQISYLDDGYKLLDQAGNTIFYTGSSELNLDIASKGDLKSTSFKANFSNVSSFDIFTLGDVIEVAANDEEEKITQDLDREATTTDRATDNNDAKEEVAKEKDELPTLSNPNKVAQKDNDTKDLKIKTNRNLIIDLKVDSILDKKTKLPEVQDVAINNLELFSPLFKINVSGGVKYLAKPNQTTDLVVKIKNIDNILIYIRKFISSLIPSSLEIVDANSVANLDQEPVIDLDTKEAKNEGVDSESEVQESIIQPIPEEVITNLIVDISEKNPNSNDQFSEFKIVGEGSSFTINDVTTLEILERLTPVMEFLVSAFIGNEDSGNITPQPSIDEDVLVDSEALAPPSAAIDTDKDSSQDSEKTPSTDVKSRPQSDQ